MAWSAATRPQYGRAHDDRQDDLTDTDCTRLDRQRATDPRRDPVPAVVGVPVAAQAALSSAVHFCAWRNDGTLARAQERSSTVHR